MPPRSLAEWLAHIERLHPRSIDLGLDRVRGVAAAMALPPPACPVVTVAGTNGKGSSVALLEAILSAAGHRVAAYTSPHLLRYNERVRIGGAEAGDDALCAAFERVERARAGRTLTYFEFGTLAALDLFARAQPDVLVLEVGLGGRLDAVNLVDADVALVTSIGLDHVEWLGTDRDAIAREKAGVMRPGRPAVCADPGPPPGLLAAAAAIGATLYRAGDDFGWRAEADGERWSWRGPRGAYPALPRPALAGRFQFANAAGVLMAIELLRDRLAVSGTAVARGLASVAVAGRFQCLPGAVARIFDVAHNADGARALAETLAAAPAPGRTRAVFAVLADKDVEGMAAAMARVVDDWHVAPLAVARGASAERVLAALAGPARAQVHGDVAAAYRAALAASSPGDRVVVFGSFHTVGAALGVERGRPPLA
jgi:dihydrofolate synthase/folylpolyglutamate synthase